MLRFFRWDISVICPIIASKLAVTVLTSSGGGTFLKVGGHKYMSKKTMEKLGSLD